MNIFLVICNYNAARHLEGVFEAIHSNIRPNVLVCAVDNASKDGSLEVLKSMQTRKWINILVTSDTNIGKAQAVNKLVESVVNGVPVTEYDVVFSLDSDISLMSENFFDKAFSYLESLMNKVSCVVCQQLGNSLFRRNIEWRDGGKGFQYFADPTGYGIAGGAIMVPLKFWRKAGGYETGRGVYGGNDGQLMLNLFNYTGLPMCVIRELMVFHPYEMDAAYQKWKDQAHQQQIQQNKCVFEKGFYDK